MIDVDHEQVAAALIETDALTPTDAETLHPTAYTVDAENLPYLVQTVLALAYDRTCAAEWNPTDDDRLTCNRSAGHQGNHFDPDASVSWNVSVSTQ